MAVTDVARSAPATQLQPRFFIPVCLYPHTRYRTRRGIEDLIAKFRLAEFDHLIVVADHLLALDKIVTGRFWNEAAVFEKTRREGGDVFRLIGKVARSEEASDRCRLAYWDEVAESDAFVRFRNRLLAACHGAPDFMAVIERFVDGRVARFGMGADPERERRAEFDYIIGELSMSVYCTEVLGYWNEIWERPLEAGAIDPLGIVYRDFPDIVTTACQRSRTRRRLSFLYDAPRKPLGVPGKEPVPSKEMASGSD